MSSLYYAQYRMLCGDCLLQDTLLVQQSCISLFQYDIIHNCGEIIAIGVVPKSLGGSLLWQLLITSRLS